MDTLQDKANGNADELKFVAYASVSKLGSGWTKGDTWVLDIVPSADLRVLKGVLEVMVSY